MQIRLANTRGFCAGVDRAIEIVKKVLEQQGPPVYVKHEVVHNKTVVEELKELGAIFVEDVGDIPEGEVVIYSAHGISKAVEIESKNRNLDIYDATCPLVSKVHAEVNTYAKMGYHCILIGHKNHPEVEGTMGQFDTSYGGTITLIEDISDVEKLKFSESSKVAFVTQTTLSVDDTQELKDSLINKFPDIIGPKKDDICYATQNRQDAVKQLALESDLVIVIGSENSSNSNRLREIAERSGVKAYLIDSVGDLPAECLEGKKRIGLTSGASAPEHLVSEVIDTLTKKYGFKLQGNRTRTDEGISFRLPKGLR
ncbi:MAG: 4-hydroxy-3-methylbut-2-enyl diphosphate reductase [Pseudomonadota bacterium]|jgi:4-hydroxy-3-methylbut-2-enyl diphosphate reductase|nr:4-hydroxy-3-methylbut-2-enyl diphosphate reductase [Pseudomonadota bacterium]MEC8798533.1 4-hydroxy-3-methylbut-2-enyl diphosphate reductase [Pseudomonadota bacterium]GIR87502.1 MAG: 4-hydroxy-3-methylbut-2-enyl diphosphate reductase [Gammaproteobacteria bacterium]|tara:strand:- start:841 stop:1776 length:936 start_codon:yes stop_codon:yes gene_type:complete